MPNQPTVDIIDVTPTHAETWLSRNPNNRNIRKGMVEAHARDMLAGRWILNGESVKIDDTGHLLDGQHRLSAVVAAEVSVPMIVISGLPADVMATVDAGTKRTYVDALALAINAWNAHRAGEHRSNLQLPRGGLTPENFPEPR